MKVVDSPEALALAQPVLSIGNFDGVHLGHRLLLERMRTLAQELARPSAVVTFFPPSKVVFANAPFLSSADEKLNLLSRFAPDGVAMIPFSLEYARTDKRVFLSQLESLRPAAIIVGEDFRFGHRREGTLNDLSLAVARLEVFGLEKLAGEPIKSSRIRDLLAQGLVLEAARLLGEPYPVIGEVVAGDHRGRQLGYPTANLAVPPGKALPVGVFSVTVKIDGEQHGGMANSGPRPSFPEGAPALEVHLFDFAGDLYGRRLRVAFVDRIRDQQRFDSLESLRSRLAEDERVARDQLQRLAAG